MTTIDNEQRLCAIDTQKSFVVRAPAGSGKTELLVQRVLNALLSVSAPSSCLILTFTQKAVSELQSRITKIFIRKDEDLLPQTAQLKRKVLIHAKQQKWPITTFWYQIKVRTIDSYFIELVTKFSPQMKFDNSTIGVSPEQQSRLIVEAFFKEFLVSNPDQKLLELCAAFENSFSQLQNLLQELYLMREVWLINVLKNEEYLPQSEEFFKDQVSSFLNIFEGEEENLEQIYLWISSYLEDIPVCKFDGDEVLEQLSLWKVLANLLMTRTGGIRKRFTKHQGLVADKDLLPWHSKDDKKSIIQLISQLQEKLQAEPELIKFLDIVQIWPEKFSQGFYLEHWLYVLKKLIAYSQVYKDTYNLIDYSDVTLELWTLLHSADSWPAVCATLEKDITHLFLDECQDLSYIQFNILKKVISTSAFDHEKSFFVVGDPQQAIYHFRGSEVGIFQSFECLKIDGISFENLTLRSNFRSSQKLVNFFNQCSDIFFAKESYPFLGIDKALDASSTKTIAYSTLESKCFIDPIDEAIDIVLDIKKSTEQCKEMTIGVLARDRKSLKPIINQLKIFKVPFVTTGIYHLFDIEQLFDCYSLVRIVLEPENKSFWLSALRSHFLGANITDLQKFYTNERESFFSEPLDSTFSLVFQSHYQKLSQHYQRFIPFIDREKLNIWLEKFFKSFGYLDYISLSQYELWIKLFLPFKNLSPTKIAWEDVEEHLRRIPVEVSSDCHVHVMTIHQAKGLEFDKVYLPNLAAALPNMKSKLLHSLKTPKDFLWSIYPPSDKECQTFSFCQAVASLHQKHEAMRLLYVGITRAKAHLYVSYNQENNYGNNFKSVLEELIGFEEHEKIAYVPETSTSKLRPILPFDHSLPTLDWRGFKFNEEPLSEVSEKQVSRCQRVLGLTWHKILQHQKSWPLNLKALDSQLLVETFYSYGALEDDLKRLMSSFSKVYTQVINSSIGKFIFDTTHIQSYSEYPLLVLSKGKLVKRVIDKVIIDRNNQVWIVEIKTSSITELDNETAEVYIKQLSQYESYLNKLFKTRARPMFWFLKDDKFLELQELQECL